jgi:predicted nucleic acid-binding protein
VIVYVDSSVLARAYLADEVGHDEAVALLGGEQPLVSSTWTLVEVTSALARAARSSRRAADLPGLLDALRADVAPAGPVTLLRTDPTAVEARATEIVREHALRSLDGLHLAVAELAARPLAEPDESVGFASRDVDQTAVAEGLGFIPV